MKSHETLLTISEAARDYFQGKVSGRELTRLFHDGKLTGFRVGRSKKSKILLYRSGLENFRLANENQQPEWK